MKAVQISQYGAANVLELNQDAPKAVSGKEQVLIEVHAASINPIDWKVRTGYMKDAVPFTMPATLGGIVAGRCRPESPFPASKSETGWRDMPSASGGSDHSRNLSRRIGDPGSCPEECRRCRRGGCCQPARCKRREHQTSARSKDSHMAPAASASPFVAESRCHVATTAEPRTRPT